MKTKTPVFSRFQFDLIPDPDRTDGGGVMRVTASDAAGKQALFKHFSLFDDNPIEAAQHLLSQEPFVHEESAGTRDNYAFFEISGSLDLGFTSPYFGELFTRTGFRLPTSECDIGADFLTPRYTWEGLCHTHYLKEVAVEAGLLTYTVFTSHCDWNRKKAAENAVDRSVEVMQESLGNRPSNPEYLSIGMSDSYRKNPDYLKRNAVQKGLHSEWFWNALIDWWLENHASKAQKQLVQMDRDVMYANHKGSGTLRDIRGYDKGLRRSWEAGGVVPWIEFSGM